MSAPSINSLTQIARTTPKRQTRAKLIGLQILRFVAAFAVVLFHIGSGYQIKWGYEGNLFAIGAAGVDIFFVISGFIIAYTTDVTRGAWHFCRRRIVRIVPLYWILTLGVAAIALIKPELLNSTLVNGETLFKSLFFIPFEKVNGTIQPILFLGWTLNYEMFFYSVYAICIAAGLRMPLAPAVLISLLVAIGSVVQVEHVAWRFYTNPIMLEFVFGIGLYAIHSRWPEIFQRQRLLLAVLGLLIVLRHMLPGLPWIFANGVPAAALVAFALTWAPKHTPLIALFVLFGDASYSLYLSHPYIIEALTKFLPEDTGLVMQVLAGAVSSCLAIIVAVTLYKIIEQPSQRLLTAHMESRQLAQSSG